MFTANRKPKNSRKLWISGALQVKGKIYIDQGAENAITRGNSILPAGIVKTEGKYNKGDLISILNIEGKILGKGLSHYSNIEVNLVKGLQSDKIETILGYRGKDEIIHKDDFVLEKRDDINDMNNYVETLQKNSKIAFKELSNSSIEQRNSMIINISELIKKNSSSILDANELDLKKVKEKYTGSFFDRLTLNKKE